MDPVLHHRYLDAMGIQLWRLRDGPEDAVVNDPPALRTSDGADAAPPRARAPVEAPGGSHGVPSPGAATDARGGGIETMDWGRLQAAVSGCRACGLCETRTQTVFGSGNRDADLMIIGEAPGADEDRQGEPFVGRAGRLLTLMLAAIGLERNQVYIANILKCRPPGNRDPLAQESAACRSFLMRQVTLVRPRILLSVGRVSAQDLLGTDEAIGRLRGRWFEFGPGRIPLRVTYHPSYLLRSPGEKAKSWQDLLQVAQRLSQG